MVRPRLLLLVALLLGIACFAGAEKDSAWLTESRPLAHNRLLLQKSGAEMTSGEGSVSSKAV
jgi:hypothetical protein